MEVLGDEVLTSGSEGLGAHEDINLLGLVGRGEGGEEKEDNDAEHHGKASREQQLAEKNETETNQKAEPKCKV